MGTDNPFLIKEDTFQAELNRIGQNNNECGGSPYDFLLGVANFASSHASLSRIAVSFTIHLPGSFKKKQAVKEITFYLNATGAATNGQWRPDTVISHWTSRWDLGGSVNNSTDRHTLSSIESLHDGSTDYKYPLDHKQIRFQGKPNGEIKEVTVESLHPVLNLHNQLVKTWLTSTKRHSAESRWHLVKRAYEVADNDASCDRLLWVGAEEAVGVLERRDLHDTFMCGPEERLPKNMSTQSMFNLRREEYEPIRRQRMLRESIDMQSQAFIALGSNLGDRAAMLEDACRIMSDKGIRVVRTSALYKTKPMYFEDQQDFLNGVCEVSCLLKQCFGSRKQIESTVDRNKFKPPKAVGRIKRCRK